MIITCESCSTRFVLDDALIKSGGSKVKCSKCKHIFTAFPEPPTEEHPVVEVPDTQEHEEHDIPFDEPEFDEPEFKEDSSFAVSQDHDFSIDSDSDGQDIDFEEIDDTDIDFQDIEEFDTPAQEFDEGGLDFETADFQMEEPEPNSQDVRLELDSQDFELEKIEDEPSLALASMPSDSDDKMADIEISFSRDEGPELELEELPQSMDDGPQEASSIGDLELDMKTDEVPGLDFEKGPQTDLILEDDGGDSLPEPEKILPAEETVPKEGLPEENLIDEPAPQSDDIIIEGQSDLSLPDDNNGDKNDNKNDDNVDDNKEPDEKIEQSPSEQEKFAGYDKVLDQDTEPEDIGISILDPEVEDKADSPASPIPPTDDAIEDTTETLIEQTPLITPPYEESDYQQKGTKKKRGVSLPFKIILVLILLILAGYVAISRLGITIPGVSDIQIPVISEWLQPKQPPPPQPSMKPIPDEPSINERFVSNKNAGNLFIVTGRIKNMSKTAVSYIQVQGTLMTKNDTKSGSLTAYCGNIIPEQTLKSGNVPDITKQMEVKEGIQNTNVNVKPGASVMFMLVFSSLPEDLANYTVAVKGFEPAEK